MVVCKRHVHALLLHVERGAVAAGEMCGGAFQHSSFVIVPSFAFVFFTSQYIYLSIPAQSLAVLTFTCIYTISGDSFASYGAHHTAAPSMDQAKRGADAFAAGRYADAIQDYSLAIKASPQSPDYHVKRSTAYQRVSPPELDKALADAEKAVILARDRAKRELIVQAQMRRVITLFALERYADAKFLLGIVRKMDPKEKTLDMWETKIDKKLGALGEDHPAASVTVTEIPTASIMSSVATPEAVVAEPNKMQTSAVKTEQKPMVPAQTPADKIRHDWYQNHDNVIFTLLAKGVPKDEAVVEIQESSLSISFPLITGSTYEFSLDPLFATVDPSASKFNVMSTKIEVTMRKGQPGQKWGALESKEIAGTNGKEEKPVISKLPVGTSKPTEGPAYPTSSRSGAKNWDKLANELTAKKPKKESKDGASDGKNDDEDDWDYDKEDGDEVNAFFKKIYAGADPDTRRAMTKSFVESGGTALSTNWGEVATRSVHDGSHRDDKLDP